MPAATLSTALAAAARAVAAVIAGRNVDAVLAEAKLGGELAAAARDLAFGALRQYGRGDFFLSQLLDRPLAMAEMRGLLLAAFYRLELRPEDGHTTVNQAVEAAAQLSGGRLRGLANGVLRNFLRQQEALKAAAAEDLVARWQHPAWWIRQLQADHPDCWQGILEAGNGRAPMALRVNRRRARREEILAALADAGIGASPGDEDGILLEKPVAVTALPGFAEGRVSVQDIGAQWAARLLDVCDGQRVLDACAAPGGKTGHVLERAEANLLALELDDFRCRRVRENLDRLGLAARVQTADCRLTEQWWDGQAFDRVLADVPCSASGVVRRHPDAKWLRRAADIGRFARQQAQILDSLWQVLAPGGKMLVCTCSVFAAENGRQIREFADRHPDAVRLPTGPAGEMEFQLLPDAAHDGFFYALLAKSA